MSDSQAGSGRRSSKSAQAFRTISEVAQELDIPQHVLRFWETKFDAVRPLKRGGGRRYYRPEDVGLLATIRRLLYEEGYTIKGVQKLLREERLLRDGTLRDDGPAREGAGPVGAGDAQAVARDEMLTALDELRAIRDRLRRPLESE